LPSETQLVCAFSVALGKLCAGCTGISARYPSRYVLIPVPSSQSHICSSIDGKAFFFPPQFRHWFPWILAIWDAALDVMSIHMCVWCVSGDVVRQIHPCRYSGGQGECARSCGLVPGPNHSK
jgi:hypothetical protein